MTLATWFAFALASVVLLLIPGPTVLLVVSYALTQGRKVAVAMGRQASPSATSPR